ncbi:hypothetical protein E2C01_030870 [Portunus trituberculatus]|uniref:Uncharacterized protein n=1 Tax=Portunus trituberculatus TaxID=210409 RepID=A0A5B7EVC9_PORTR|nr:hypothetical protein [Portunus trituberculatus]
MEVLSMLSVSGPSLFLGKACVLGGDDWWRCWDKGYSAQVWGRDLMLVILELCGTWSSLKNVMPEYTIVLGELLYCLCQVDTYDGTTYDHS